MADPAEYPNLFSNWVLALKAQENIKEQLSVHQASHFLLASNCSYISLLSSGIRSIVHPASEYPSFAGSNTIDVLETLRESTVEEPVENGLDHVEEVSLA